MTHATVAADMKGYLEYLELYVYFAIPGAPKLSREDFASADAEWKELSARFKQLDADELARVRELKAILFRDKP